MEGLKILVIDLLFDLFVFNIDPLDLVLVHIDLAQQAFFKILLIPGGQDHGIVNLPQVGESFAFVDFFFDFRNQHFADDFRGNTANYFRVFLYGRPAGRPYILFIIFRHGLVIFFQHDFQMAVYYIGTGLMFKYKSFFRDNPYFIKGIHRDFGRPVKLIGLFIDPVPELLA
ncbi:MAG: hypothetical protein JW847_06990 [Candidatus Omnitrophica bacterium]|nr:hypothetical protein [Candidatus Omnitrophota bacterium]